MTDAVKAPLPEGKCKKTIKFREYMSVEKKSSNDSVIFNIASSSKSFFVQKLKFKKFLSLLQGFKYLRHQNNFLHP